MVYLLISLLVALSSSFYLEAGEKKCFREELSPETSIVGEFYTFAGFMGL